MSLSTEKFRYYSPIGDDVKKMYNNSYKDNKLLKRFFLKDTWKSSYIAGIDNKEIQIDDDFIIFCIEEKWLKSKRQRVLLPESSKLDDVVIPAVLNWRKEIEQPTTLCFNENWTIDEKKINGVLVGLYDSYTINTMINECASDITQIKNQIFIENIEPCLVLSTLVQDSPVNLPMRYFIEINDQDYKRFVRCKDANSFFGKTKKYSKLSRQDKNYLFSLLTLVFKTLAYFKTCEIQTKVVQGNYPTEKGKIGFEHVLPMPA